MDGGVTRGVKTTVQSGERAAANRAHMCARRMLVVMLAILAAALTTHPSVALASQGPITAQPEGTCGLCVLAPSGQSLRLTGNGSVTLTNANVLVNSWGFPAVSVTGNGSLLAPSVGVAGTVAETGKGTIENLTTGVTPISDPLAGLAVPSIPVPNAVPSINVNGNDAETIGPGVYQDINVSGGGSLTLTPGTYIIRHQLASTGNANITANDVTIYLACSSYPTPCNPGEHGASLNLTGGGSLNLAGPTENCTPVAVFADRNNNTKISLTGGGSEALNGIIYAQSGELALTGNGSLNVREGFAVVGTANITGNGNLEIGSGFPLATGLALTLSPSPASPHVGETEKLSATLTCHARPLANQPILISTTGANNNHATATTNSEGIASLSYTGKVVGSETANASFTAPGIGTSATPLSINWSKAQPSIATSVSKATTEVGTPVTDTAKLSGGYIPTGTVRWNVYAGSDTTCKTPLNTSALMGQLTNGSAQSPAFTPTEGGTYQFVATYEGDTNNQPASTKCGDAAEQVTVAVSAAGINPVATTTVEGNFYAADPAAQTFTAKPGDTPAFAQSFPAINFNPPAGTIPHFLDGLPAVDPTTRPFTDITTDEAGNANGEIIAHGNGQQAGTVSLNTFDAALTANFVVPKAGDITFAIVHDDGFLLGIGGGAVRVSGAYENPPSPETTAFKQYPLLGVFDTTTGSSPATDHVTVHFPKPGIYPYELDYFESGANTQLSLTMSVASAESTTCKLCVYVGYADGLRPAGSIFPFPWKGSPGVTFIGGGTFDSGALRLDNETDTPTTLESVTVDIGANHFDIWPHNLSVPPHEELILAQTEQYNFDTSDFSGSGCGSNNGVKPTVTVVSGGKPTVFTDSNQVLNTKGYDLACEGNESTSWQLVGGGAPAINRPLPPADTLTLSPAQHTTLNVGQEQLFTAAVMDSNGKAVAHLPVTLTVRGTNGQTLTAETDATGVAKFAALVGRGAGEDQVQATALPQGRLAVSNTTAITWNILKPGTTEPGGTPGQAAPSITGIAPVDGASVDAPICLTASIQPPTRETVSSVTATAQGQSPGSHIHDLKRGKCTSTGQIAELDPTVLPDDTYTISIAATASGGGIQTVNSTVVIHGGLKLGRYTTTYQDLSVPVNGFQMQVRRVYDSIDKEPGDFGVGWHLELTNFRASTNRELGAGGWSEYGTSCFFALCLYAFKTSVPHDVTITFPDGHQEEFAFTPKGGSTLFNEVSPGFEPRPATNTTSQLQALNGGNGLGLTAAGDIVNASGEAYNPTRFRLTTRDKKTLILDTTLGLISEEDANHNSLTIDSKGVHSHLGPNGREGPSITFTRGAQGRIEEILGPLPEQQLHYSYEGGELHSVTGLNGSTTTYSYDPTTGNLASAAGPGGRPLETVRYDPSGRVISVANGSEPPTTISSDVPGRQETLLDPAGKLTTVLTYDQLGDIVERDQTFNGKTLKSTFTYDPLGRVTSATDPAEHETSATYDEKTGDVLSLTDPANRTWHLENYNLFGKPGTVRQPDGSVYASFKYDPETGKLVSENGPEATQTVRTYWPSGQVKSITDPGGRSLNFTYDPEGHVASISDNAGHTTRLTTNAAGELTMTEDQLGNKTSFSYTPEGQLAELTEPNDNKYHYYYDPLGRLHQTEDPLHESTYYEYNSVGELTKRKDRNDAVTTYSYDADGRLTQETRPGDEQLNFTYDPLGRLSETDDPASQIDRSYTDASKLATETSCANTGSTGTPCGTAPSATQPVTTLSYSYGPDGELESLSGPETGATHYGYDSDGRLATVEDPTHGLFHFGYDPLGRLDSLTRPNGVDDTLAYTPSGDLQTLDVKLNEKTILPFEYQIDPATGRITALTDSSGTHTFTYNAKGQLTAATHPSGSGLANETYKYDAAGNRTSGTGIKGTATYNADDELLSDGYFNYTYDNEGNLRTKTPVGGGPGTTYEWNADHQLTKVIYPDGSSSRYSYDALGRRVRTINRGNDTRYAYNGLTPYADYNEQNHLLTSYVTGPSLDSALEMTEGGLPSYFVSDGLGTTRALTGPTGEITGRYTYNSFGIPAGTNPKASRFTFTGDQYDATSELYDANARYYSPSTGRFIGQDPIHNINPYIYANSDPVDYLDPTGEQAFAEYTALVKRDAEADPGLQKIGLCTGLGLVVGFTTGNADAAAAIATGGIVSGFKEFYSAEIGTLGPILDAAEASVSRDDVVAIAEAINEVFKAGDAFGDNPDSVDPLFKGYDDTILAKKYAELFGAIDPNANPKKIAEYCAGG